MKNDDDQEHDDQPPLPGLRLVDPPKYQTEFVAYGFGYDEGACPETGPLPGGDRWFCQVQMPFRPDRLIVWTTGEGWPGTCFVDSVTVAGREQLQFPIEWDQEHPDARKHVAAVMFKAPVPLGVFWSCMKQEPEGFRRWTQIPGRKEFRNWPVEPSRKHLLSSTITPRLPFPACNVGSRIEISYSAPLLGLAFLGEAVCDPP